MDLRVGDEVTRVLAGLEMKLKITRLTEDSIECGDWLFDRESGMEIDDVLEWGPIYGKSGSFLREVASGAAT